MPQQENRPDLGGEVGIQAVRNLDGKQSCRVATTANITLSGLQTIDGIALIDDQRVLVKNQTDPIENGIYLASVGAWARSEDADEDSEVTASLFVFIDEGTQAQTSWLISTPDTIIVGTTAITFVQFGVSVTTWTGLTDTPVSHTANAIYKSNGADLVVSTLTDDGTTITSGVVHAFQLGSALLPGVTPIGDPNTGPFSPGADSYSISTGGTQAILWNATQQSLHATGTAALPSVGSILDPDTGGFWNATNSWAITAGGAVCMQFATSQGLFNNGTAGAPGGAFAGQKDTGLYQDLTASLSITAGGANVAAFRAASILINPLGTPALPVIALRSDIDTGILWIGPDNFGLSAGGTTRVDINTLRTRIIDELEVLRGTSTGVAPAAASAFIIDDNAGDVLIQILSSTTANAGINFNDATGDQGGIQYNHASDFMRFIVAGNVNFCLMEEVGASDIASVESDGILGIADGVVIPPTKAGVAYLFVDSADGDLKVKFGDGVVKTIATDV